MAVSNSTYAPAHKPPCPSWGAPAAYRVYPGVCARADWKDWPHRRPRIFFEGFEADLRRAGLLLDTDRLPQQGFASRLGNGELRLMFREGEAAARDKAFQRFMALAIGQGV